LFRKVLFQVTQLTETLPLDFEAQNLASTSFISGKWLFEHHPPRPGLSFESRQLDKLRSLMENCDFLSFSTFLPSISWPFPAWWYTEYKDLYSQMEVWKPYLCSLGIAISLGRERAQGGCDPDKINGTLGKKLPLVLRRKVFLSFCELTVTIIKV
jgi:hypothetical protein